VLTLGFAADCLETLEEIGVGRRREVRGAAEPQRRVTYDLPSSIAKGLDFRSRARLQIWRQTAPAGDPVGDQALLMS
jgi:hypothetical protein